MKLDKELAFAGGAAIVSGIATAIIAPTVAGKIANTADPKNWYATGGVAVGLGVGILLLGGKSAPMAAAGAAMIGAGASFAYLGYQGYKLSTGAAAGTTPAAGATPQVGAGNLMMGNLVRRQGVMGNLVPHRRQVTGQSTAVPGTSGINQPFQSPAWSGIPMTAQQFAAQSGMPVASGPPR